MTFPHFRLLLCSFLFLCNFSACAAPKSYVMLLPKDGKPSGEVTVTNSGGTRVLNRSWEMTEISDAQAPPEAPVVVEGTEGREVAQVLTTLPLQPVRFLLYFRLNSVEMLPESRQLLAEIRNSIKLRKPAQVTLVGHTDSVASESYNFELGRQRAETVLALLRLLGADPAKVEILSRGKLEPLVPTRDQTWEPRNRRVEIMVR